MYEEFQKFVMSRLFPSTFVYDYDTVFSNLPHWVRYSNYSDLETFTDAYTNCYFDFQKSHKPVAQAAVTISPQSRETPATCLKVIDILKTIKPFTKGVFVIEQTSEDPNNPGGFHLHGIVESTYQPTKVNQFIQQKLKSHKVTANVLVKRCNTDGWMRYMEGVKGDEEKTGKILADKLIRDKFGLGDKYFW